MKKQNNIKKIFSVIGIVLCLFFCFTLLVPMLSGAISKNEAKGEKGDTGNGIHSVDKTATNGLTDTYTITFTDGSTYTYTLTNGEKGETGATGATGNGIQSIEKTATEGLVDTYTITFTNGSIYTYTVTNGADGESISGGTTIPAEAIIDVDELPQELEVYSLFNGQKNMSANYIPMKIHIVDTLSETGEAWAVLDSSQTTIIKFNLYFQKSDYCVYSFMSYEDDGWVKLDDTYIFISSDEEATEADTPYLVVKENDINTQAFYRVMEGGEAYIYAGGQKMDDFEGVSLNWHAVNTLPETGPTFDINAGAPSSMDVYFNLSDGMVYIYMPMDEETWQWLDFLTEMPAEAYGGVISSEAEATNPELLYIVYNPDGATPKLYHYKNGWNEVGGTMSGGVSNQEWKTFTIDLSSKEFMDSEGETGKVADITNDCGTFFDDFYFSLLDNESFTYQPLIMKITETMDGKTECGYAYFLGYSMGGYYISLPKYNDRNSESYIVLAITIVDNQFSKKVLFYTNDSYYISFGKLTVMWK